MSTCPGVTLTGEPASCVCVCVCVPPPRRAARLSPKMVSPADLCVVSALCCTPLRWEVPALQMFHDVQMGGSQGVLLTSGHFDRLSPQPGPAHDSWSPPNNNNREVWGGRLGISSHRFKKLVLSLRKHWVKTEQATGSVHFLLSGCS